MSTEVLNQPESQLAPAQPQESKVVAQTPAVAAKKPRGRPRKVAPEPSTGANSESNAVLNKGKLDFGVIFEKPILVLLIGSSKSGKSYLTKSLLLDLTQKRKLFKFGVVFSATSFNGDYDYIDKPYVFNSFDEEEHANYVKKLQEMKEELQENMPANFIVYDDLLGLLQKTKNIENWFSTFRHTNTYIFLTSQYLANATSSTLVRTQTGLMFAFNERAKSTRKALYEWFCSGMGTYDEFCAGYDQATSKQHYALCYVKGVPHGEFPYFSYKAPDALPPVKLKFGKKQGQEGQANPTSGGNQASRVPDVQPMQESIQRKNGKGDDPRKPTDPEDKLKLKRQLDLALSRVQW